MNLYLGFSRNMLLLLVITFSTNVLAQDANNDRSRINESCKGLQHLLSLFTIHGIPQNQNTDDSLSIIINHGYCLGFSHKYNQPRWAAYQVSKSTKDVDYERFPFFTNDSRLPAKNQIGNETFGNGYDLGHMVPNAAINRQYGKLAQMETFLMSNISPQKAELNRGVWQKLEQAIRETYCFSKTEADKEKEHIWVIVGPVFSANPEFIERKNGTKSAIPTSFFCILVRPSKYPYDSPANAEYQAFVFPQELPMKQQLDVSFLKSINQVETLTKLNFFPHFTKHYEEKIETDASTVLW